MYGPYLTMAEIEAKYPNAWLVLDHSDLGDRCNIAGGVVVYHTADEDEFSRVARTIETNDIPRYHCTRPRDPDEMFCTRLSVGWFEGVELIEEENGTMPPTGPRLKRWWQFWR